MDKPRVVTVRKFGFGWAVFFNVSVPLRGEASFEARSYLRDAMPDLPEDARYFWWAEVSGGGLMRHSNGDALGAYVWGQKLIEETNHG